MLFSSIIWTILNQTKQMLIQANASVEWILSMQNTRRPSAKLQRKANRHHLFGLMVVSISSTDQVWLKVTIRAPVHIPFWYKMNPVPSPLANNTWTEPAAKPGHKNIRKCYGIVAQTKLNILVHIRNLYEILARFTLWSELDPDSNRQSMNAPSWIYNTSFMVGFINRLSHIHNLNAAAFSKIGCLSW